MTQSPLEAVDPLRTARRFSKLTKRNPEAAARLANRLWHFLVEDEQCYLIGETTDAVGTDSLHKHDAWLNASTVLYCAIGNYVIKEHWQDALRTPTSGGDV